MTTEAIVTSYVQHAPGPWEAVGSMVRTRLTAGEREGLLVADCYRGSYWTPETREANTRLIAAAPEMLDALRAIASASSGERADPADVLRYINEIANGALGAVVAGV